MLLRTVVLYSTPDAGNSSERGIFLGDMEDIIFRFRERHVSPFDKYDEVQYQMRILDISGIKTKCPPYQIPLASGSYEISFIKFKGRVSHDEKQSSFLEYSVHESPMRDKTKYSPKFDRYVCKNYSKSIYHKYN